MQLGLLNYDNKRHTKYAGRTRGRNPASPEEGDELVFDVLLNGVSFIKHDTLQRIANINATNAYGRVAAPAVSNTGFAVAA